MARTDRSGGLASSRFGPWLAALWLVFLLDPLAAAWRIRAEPRGLIGVVAVLAFGIAYLALWAGARRYRGNLVLQPPARVGVPAVASLAAIGVLVTACVGPSGLACAVYIAAGSVLAFPLVPAAAVTAGLVTLVVVAGPAAGWGSQIDTASGVLLGAVAVLGLRATMSRSIQLVLAHDENALLAAENERSRVARDLHDILGHSLTVITVKAELARRISDTDPDRARRELADLERLSRDALADVRRAVEGYRDLTLPGELARARMALGSAGIRAEVPNATDDVPTELRDLFAWTVREGVTNVIRHSGAGSCVVRLTAVSAEVRDDGVGPSADRGGTGLAGLRERAAAVGAVLRAEPLDPGFRLLVTTS